MQRAMKVLCVVILLVAITTAVPEKICPKIQEIDLEIEFLIPHRECDKFYQCTDGHPVKMSCPRGLFYSIIDEVCQWGDRVDCGARLITGYKKPEITPGPGGNYSGSTEKPEFPVIDFRPNGCPVDLQVHWLLPHESVCKLYYHCDGGERELRRCPFGLYFNKKRQICDWPQNVTCKTTEQE